MSARRAALLPALALLGACGTAPCEQFYDIYQKCGFGTATQAVIDKCHQGIATDQNCKNALLDLDYCARHLANQCTYDTNCKQYLDFLKMYCDI